VIAFQVGRGSGLRAADELVDQLAEQLRAAHKEIATLRNEPFASRLGVQGGVGVLRASRGLLEWQQSQYFAGERAPTSNVYTKGHHAG
jgi:hypothetical protein